MSGTKKGRAPAKRKAKRKAKRTRQATPAKRKARKKSAGKGKSAAAELVSVRAAARALEVSHTAVQKAIASGRLSRSIRRRANGRGYLVDVAAARAELDANTDQSQAGKGGDPKRPSPSSPGPLFGGEEETGEEAATGGAGSYQVARARREFYRAEQEELEYRHRRGELVERKEEERAAYEIARAVRDRLIALADNLAPRVIGLDDLAAVRRLLLEETTSACEELWKRFGTPRDDEPEGRKR